MTRSFLACLILAAFSTLTNTQDGQSVDIGETEVSSTVLAYFCDPDDSCAPIFEHVKNPTWEQGRKRYYVFPQFRVDPETLSWKSAPIFNRHYVEFSVQMFDQCYLQKVAAHLTTVVGNEVKAFQVAPYSLHQVRLNWADAPDPNLGIKMSQSPIPQTAQSSRIEIRIYTDSGEKARDLAGNLKLETKLFDFFRLEYSLSAAGVAKQLVTVKTESVSQTDFFTKIQNKIGESNSVYLSSEDLGQLTQETFQKLVAAQFKDADFVVSVDNRILIQDLIKEAMVIDQGVISSAEDQRWNSVFWDEDWARPDHLTQFLNEKFAHDQGASRNFSFFNEDIRNYLEQHSTSDRSLGLNVAYQKFKLGGGASEGSTSSSESETNKKRTITEEEMQAWLQQNHHHIKWTGQQFQLKPMELSRVNLQKLRSETTLTVTSVQSRQVRVDGKAKLRVQTADQQSCSDVAEAWDLQLQKLGQDLQKMKELRDGQINQINRKLETKADKTSLESKFDVLAQKSTALQNTSIALSSSLNRLNTETAPLREAEFCIWKKGPCPVGFVYAQARQWGVNVYSTNSKYSGFGHIGDSQINYENTHYVQINLHACCK